MSFLLISLLRSTKKTSTSSLVQPRALVNSLKLSPGAPSSRPTSSKLPTSFSLLSFGHRPYGSLRMCSCTLIKPASCIQPFMKRGASGEQPKIAPASKNFSDQRGKAESGGREPSSDVGRGYFSLNSTQPPGLVCLRAVRPLRQGLQTMIR